MLDSLRREELSISWAKMNEKERDEYRHAVRVPDDYPGPVATDWPEFLAVVEQQVKPERMRNNRAGYRTYWWQYGEKRVDLYAAIAGLERVLAVPQTSNVQALVFLSPQMVFGHTLIVFPLDTYSAFSVLQSRIHQIWSAFLGPTMKDDLRYTPSDCFETFPFPDDWEIHSSLEAAGKTYYEHRAALMIRNDEGMTKTYNRFHDPYEDDPDISKLRALHAAMDRAVRVCPRN